MAKKVIGISADMYSLLKRMSEQGQVTKQYVMKTPNVSKTIKALMGHGFVEGIGSDHREYKLTPLGEKLIKLTPRFSGNKKDKYGQPAEVWNVNVDGDNVSNQGEQVKLREEPNKETVTDTRTLQERQEKKEGSRFISRLLIKAEDIATKVIKDLCLYNDCDYTRSISEIPENLINELRSGLNEMKDKGFDFSIKSKDLATLLDGDEDDQMELVKKFNGSKAHKILNEIFDLLV